MEIEQYILNQPLDKQDILTKIHEIIVEKDKTIKAEVELMMGKEMIIYKGKGMMKYGLANMKKHMTLHILPIYGHKPLHLKYQALLPKANFQKGCINFNNENEISLDIIQDLIVECSTIDLIKIREDYLKSKKKSR